MEVEEGNGGGTDRFFCCLGRGGGRGKRGDCRLHGANLNTNVQPWLLAAAAKAERGKRRGRRRPF